MFNIFFIIAEKIKNGVIRIVNQAQQMLKYFFEKALDYLKRVFAKYSKQAKKGYEYKGQTHFYKKKDGQFREGSDAVFLDKEMGEWYRQTVSSKVSEEEVPPQYRDIKNEEVVYDTEELDAVLSF